MPKIPGGGFRLQFEDQAQVRRSCLAGYLRGSHRLGGSRSVTSSRLWTTPALTTTRRRRLCTSTSGGRDAWSRRWSSRATGCSPGEQAHVARSPPSAAPAVWQPATHLQRGVTGRACGEEGVTEDLEGSGVGLARGAAEGVHGWSDRDVDEPGVSKCVPPAVTGQAARDAVGRQVDVTDRLLRDRSADGDVGELESPVRPQHPEDLAENARALSATRLSTPFEMATSAQPSSMGRSSARPWRNSTWSSPMSRAVSCDLASISGVMSTPTTRPWPPARCAATIESKPPPDPTSTTRSPGTADGTRTGGPHQRTTPPPGQGPQRPASGRSRAGRRVAARYGSGRRRGAGGHVPVLLPHRGPQGLGLHRQPVPAHAAGRSRRLGRARRAPTTKRAVSA